MSELVIAEAKPPFRADGLWKTTCFELFVRAEGGACQEYNFSPSSQWAAYRFSGYREGMESLPLEHEPIISSGEATRSFELSVSLPIEISAPAIIGLSAVIEEKGGRISYWALRHPPGKPDFHHPDCFALELPPVMGGSSPRT
jgi:hypothetical protein